MALKDKIRFQHGLVFFRERPETIDYSGNSFTAFRKGSVDLLQNVLIFFNLRFPETEATRHFQVFQLNKTPRENGRYGDKHIQVLARYFGSNPLTVLWTKFKAEFTTKLEPVYWTKDNAILKHNILRERHIVFEDGYSELEQLFIVASVLPVSTPIYERGLSIQNVIKTIRRTRLNERSLDALMRIAINGLPPGESHEYGLEIFLLSGIHPNQAPLIVRISKK
ncbi:LOW QUALITY PROTEIN: hypothetical protein RvY_16418 [Ramazzottius varieornatus]|uniref:Uncharacterized protein n=1 Tax=Ramazzottius varieornatus TaxID=947166 RepID=A0A1D1W5Y3_RAMVA|nr:LOW QUALITY PROTEIN: hypothetical protein RvY_16418 [Ramazzottius varieornatus]